MDDDITTSRISMRRASLTATAVFCETLALKLAAAATEEEESATASPLLSLSAASLSASDEGEHCALAWVPKDVLIYMWGKLDLRTAATSFQTCRFLRQLSRIPAVWQSLYANTFGVCFVRKRFVEVRACGAIFAAALSSDAAVRLRTLSNTLAVPAQLFGKELVEPSFEVRTDGVTQTSTPTPRWENCPWRWMCRARMLRVDAATATSRAW